MSIQGQKGFSGESISENGIRKPAVLCFAAVFSFDRYDWGNDRHPGLPYEEGILYHLHVRGFTKNPDSKVRHKGTFMGVVEKIPYLKELGVNQLLLMPIYDFDERILPEKKKIFPITRTDRKRSGITGAMESPVSLHRRVRMR
ncbi:MAG: hypothetical protein V8S22_09570 [Lachnospiraceae bacterium]